MFWENAYKKVLKNICEADINDFDTIVDISNEELEKKFVPNENATNNSVLRWKLGEDATEQDYKDFCSYAYASIGLDVNDFIEESFDENEEDDFNV